MRRISVAMLAAVLASGCSQTSNNDDDLMNRANAAGLKADANAAIGGCLTPEEAARPTSSFSAEERAQKVGCINAAMAAQINRQLPVHVDAMTTLTHVESAGTLVTYTYQVNVDAAAVPAGQMDQVKSATRSQICGSAQMQQALSMGASYLYRWQDKSGQPLGEVRIDNC